MKPITNILFQVLLNGVMKITNYLLLNVYISKTKEIIIDFCRSNKTNHEPIFIKSYPVEIVDNISTLG